LVISQSQFNFYYTDWINENDHVFFHDCIRIVHSNELSKTEWQHIFYCLSEFPSKIKLIIDEKLPYLTFIQLKTRNITTEQLYSWSTPIDLIEDYQIYLNTNVTSLSNKRFYNCTLPKFGLHCQYELIHFSWQYSSLYDLVKGFYSLADDVSLISTCYMHLQCEHDVMSLCLQWTDICDGFINCLDGIDEKDCWQLEINQCHEDEHRCQMGQCIPKSFAIDQSLISDCIDTISNNAHRQSTHPCTSVYESVLTCNDNFDTQKSWSSMYASSQSRKLLNNMHLNDCWLAFACRMNSSCANLCQVHCPDFIFYYNDPIVFRNIYLAYHKNDSYTWANVSLAHIYICYNSKYYDVFFINYRIKISFNNFTCIHFPEILPNGTYFSSKTRLDLHLFIRTTLYNRLYKYHQIYDYATEVCNGASIYHCRNSTKCISIYRLLDSVYDCPYLDDEDYPSTAMNFINKTYFKCQNSSKYIHPKLVRNNFCDCNENQFSLNCEDENFDILHVQNTILFQHICDGYIDLLTNENNTDETECQHWPCNNIYTRCNDEWNCPTNEDEAGCYVSSTSNCSLNDLSCVSYDTSQSICLSNDKINNGHIDCLGGIDEPLCQRNVPLQINQNTNEDFRYFYCLNRTSHVCISQYDLCDGVNHCENDDDERVCINYRNIYLLYNRNKIKQIRFTLEIRRSTITNVIVHALSKQTTAPYSHIGRYHCGFGLPIRIVSSSHMLTCLCPPNYYGHLCQYQNQRISLALQFQALSDSARILFAVVVQLIDNTTEKIVHSVEQLSFLSITDCQKKFNIYLLYSTRPKQSDREYAIHIDFYEKQSLIYRGSVLYPIQFPFLPVHRLAYLVQIPSANDKDKLCFNFECQHGRCIRYWNNSQRYTFCQCEQGWSGKYCQISEHFCQCSSDSICLGKSSNNRSICICSMNKFGSRCYLNNHRQSTYLCSNGFHGDRCEIPDQQLNISFENNLIQSETYVFIHFHEILMEGSSIVEISRSTTFRTISMNTQSILIQWTQKFHLVFLELSKKTYYLVYAQNTTAATTQMKINSSDRCLHINELFNRTILQWDLIRRIKYYHLPCQNQSLNLKCFHDEIHFCLCYDFYGKRLANCLQFYQNLNPNCFGRSECENHGQCLQDHPTCPTRSMCLCKACSYGRRCQFHTNGSGLSLDPILGYYILPTKTLSHQPIIIKISLLLTIIFMLTGLVNGSCSLITFKNKPVQEVGCGLYLLGSSITTIILMILLVAKFIILLLTQMTILTNMSFLQIQCYSLDFLIRICLSLDQWFNACVASERALTTIQGAKFNKKKSVIMSKRIICFLIISVVLTSIHDPISRHVIIEDNENEDQYQIKRIWCIVRYGSTLEVYNSFIHTVHFFGPFLFNFISSIILIVKKSRQQQTLHPDQSYKTILRKQFQEHKHILIAPLVLVILALPRLILTYIRTCMQSESDAWLYLCGYFISFVPPMLTFVIFILPSKFYKKQFRQTIKQYRKGIRRRLHLDT